MEYTTRPQLVTENRGKQYMVCSQNAGGAARAAAAIAQPHTHGRRAALGPPRHVLRASTPVPPCCCPVVVECPLHHQRPADPHGDGERPRNTRSRGGWPHHPPAHPPSPCAAAAPHCSSVPLAARRSPLAARTLRPTAWREPIPPRRAASRRRLQFLLATDDPPDFGYAPR